MKAFHRKLSHGVALREGNEADPRGVDGDRIARSGGIGRRIQCTASNRERTILIVFDHPSPHGGTPNRDATARERFADPSELADGSRAVFYPMLTQGFSVEGVISSLEPPLGTGTDN
jgi:hypothetical protein